MSFKDSRELGFEECKELISKALAVMLPKESCRDFPCGPVIKALCFHCRGNGFAPWSGNYDDKCQGERGIALELQKGKRDLI